ncbi:MAG: LysM peptidoglycan-binding domain-containing protein [Thermoanaerobaculia bacterium]|nr:LysM peptidoglycan-binding domain-containing protein [Thermoanaerobaculia bacterium]
MKGRAREFKHYLAALLAISSVLSLATLVGAQSPPANLHLEGDHWTAWSPPTPPEGANVYVIQTGDTLWDISGTMLGDPYLWPQLWEANQYILDAHWIYPGDPLIIPAGAQIHSPDGVVGDPMAQAVADGLADELAAADAALEESWFEDAGSTKAPVALGSESQIYCSGYIAPQGEEFPFEIAASEYDFLTPTLDYVVDRDYEDYSGFYGRGDTEKYGLGPGDIVYIAGGRADGLSAGELLNAIRPEDMVVHPVTKKEVGQFYRYRGRIRILAVQDDTSIGEIVRACDMIPVGTKLRLFEPEPVPLRRPSPMRPVNAPPSAESLVDAPAVIRSFDGVLAVGQGYLVFIDRGENQDVLPGDVFTIYRRGREGFPPVLVGELGILSVTGDTALANILESRYTVFPGDVLMLK